MKDDKLFHDLIILERNHCLSVIYAIEQFLSYLEDMTKEEFIKTLIDDKILFQNRIDDYQKRLLAIQQTEIDKSVKTLWEST